MKCICKKGECITLSIQILSIEAGRKRWHFEIHPNFGFGTINAQGDISSHQPGPHSPFWTAVTLWSQQGCRIEDGLCVWTKQFKKKNIEIIKKVK